MFYERTVLDNGVTVITEHMDSVRSVCLGLWVRVGNREESKDMWGISHFMEHMLFKGTPTRNAADISLACDSVGAELNAFTSREYTCYYARVIDERLPQVFEVLSDMLVNASFRQNEMDLESQVVIEEIARSADTPEDRVVDVFSDALMPSHPLGRPVLGTAENVAGYTSEDMHAWHDDHYTSGNVFVVASGAVDHALVVELADKWLAGLPCGSRLERPAFTEQDRLPLAAVTKDTEQAHLLYGWPSVAQEDPSRYGCSMLDAIMGGSMSSRLFTEIREKRGLVYSVFMTRDLFEGAGTAAMYAGTRPENIEEVVDVARGQFKDAVTNGVTDEEVERARELICAQLVMGLESTRPHMTRLGRMAVSGMPLLSIDETLERYRSVSRNEINELAAHLYSQDPTIAVVSPYTSEELEGKLV